MDVIPVEDDEEYVKHVSWLVIGWITLTLAVAIGLAVFVMVT
jgi:hypothetical protein